ncbi:MAG: hypothetical protein M1830_009959 [Pleopsidium flavum]|nr:MAG: hypothetical protein M1830_009959 [Pleopsidium flavum]
MQMKHYYDKKHIPKFFESDNMINLQLHCDYILLSIQNKKLKQHPKFDSWVNIKDLGNAQKLMKKFDRLYEQQKKNILS